MQPLLEKSIVPTPRKGVGATHFSIIGCTHPRGLGVQLDCNRSDTLARPLVVDVARGVRQRDGGLGSVVPCGGCIGVPFRLLPRSPSLQSFTGAAPVLRPRSPLVGAVSRRGVGKVLGGGCGCCSGRLVSLGGSLRWRRKAGVPGLEREGSALLTALATPLFGPARQQGGWLHTHSFKNKKTCLGFGVGQCEG